MPKNKTKSNLVSAKDAAKIIGVPLKKWPGNCTFIAQTFLDHKIVSGKRRYGHYHGYINPKSIFGPKPFAHHSWIETDTKIIDPTRWAFELVEPYIYCGPKPDINYDFGGNMLNAMVRELQGRAGIPKYNPDDNQFAVTGNEIAVIADLLQDVGVAQRERISSYQLAWLAHLPPTHPLAKFVYRFVEKTGLIALIPLDNREDVLGR